MLHIFIPSVETWNDKEEVFEYIGGVNLELEHSLYTVSAWEMKYKKPFLTNASSSIHSINTYIKEMCLDKTVPNTVWLCLNDEIRDKVLTYMTDPMTATTIHRKKKMSSNKIITSEQIYAWMFQLSIPMECEHWHLNRLLTLIEVCSLEGQPKKKMGRREAMEMQRALNAKRRAESGSSG